MKHSTAKIIVFILSFIGLLLAALAAAASIIILSVGTKFKTIMLVLAGAGIALALFQVYVYVGVLRFKNWARIAALILAALGILTVPVGTFFGMAIIYYFRFTKDIRELFNHTM